MDKKKKLLLFGSLFVVSLFLSFSLVKADNPSSMSLEYSVSTETLSVTISHSSGDFNTHYISEVIVTIDGILKINQSYTSQPSNIFTYNYYIEAWPLEILSFVLEVAARCTQEGVISRSIILGQRAYISKAIPGFAGFWVVLSVSMIALIVTKVRKLKNTL